MTTTQPRFKCHTEKQDRALFSDAPIVLLATGVQFGKTIVGAHKMKMAIAKFKEPEDAFLITSPTYKILNQSTLPHFLRIMEGLGRYNKKDEIFELANGRKCYFRTGTDPDSIVGITNVRFVYGDEAGLYSLYFWENIQARAAFKNAQILLTTSPYTLNWVYKDLIRPKLKDINARPDVEYIKARSIENPYFSLEFYNKSKETMDPRRFNALFGGDWLKMEGLVYDCFDADENSITPFELPSGTRYFVGIDWGFSQPFAMVLRALTPVGDHIQITEIYKTGLTLLDMIAAAKQWKQYYPIELFICDPSQPGNIAEFSRAGLPAIGADNEIAKGIAYHYELIKSRRFKVFRGDNKHTIDEHETYHYPSPEEVTVDKDVKDRSPVKQNDHAVDACRYLSTFLYKGFHTKPHDVVSLLKDKDTKMDIYERAKAVFEPSYERFDEY